MIVGKARKGGALAPSDFFSSAPAMRVSQSKCNRFENLTVPFRKSRQAPECPEQGRQLPDQPTRH